MGKKIYINNDWNFSRKGEKNWSAVRLPHANIETPFNHFDDKIYQFESVYKKEIFAKKEWCGKCVYIAFEGVAHVAKVLVNGEFIGEHFGGYTAFSFDISSALRYGENNVLEVLVDSRESCNIPPFGGVIDFLTYGGIYRDVYIEISEKTHIKDVFVSGKYGKMKLQLEIAGDIQGLNVACSIAKKGSEIFEELFSERINSAIEVYEKSIENVENWSCENPNLYKVKVVISNGGEKLDERVVTFGFRECLFKKDGFYLNGEKMKIVGLNRHQSYPYVGYAMPKRPQVLDADILKFELGLNAVRTSHYPQSQYFIDRCDEIGLLVFTEIQGWQHIGNEEWKNHAVHMAKEMVLQYRNHPSIILWGARINESQDDDEFYKRTNEAIRNNDNSRQTGGVRFIKNSNLLEDVYTYNDFSHTGENAGLEPKSKVTSNVEAPYLVSEYNGHMFPTKGFDCESHRLDHAKRHANALESLYKNEDIAGGFGWCMFDYNTHKDFGSGDRICYHGVMNMFRIPKLASSVYKSQSDKENFLFVSSSMDIGEYPGGNISEVYAFTNADFVKLYKNGEYVASFYPDIKKYPNMPHPPILIDDFIGELIEKHEKYKKSNAESIKSVMNAIAKYGQNNLPLKYKLKMAKVMVAEKLTMQDGLRLYYTYVGNWGGEATTYRFEGVKNDKVVSVSEKSASNKIVLKAICDSQTLHEENGYDVASIRVQITNEYGEILPYYQGVVHFETEGELEIIGEKTVSAIGGGTGTYVKTTGKKGVGTLKISSGIAKDVVLDFEII